MRYLPHTDVEISDMLKSIGVSSTEDLFDAIPAENRVKGLAIADGLDESSLMAQLTKMAASNTAHNALSFLGAGMYDHHIPPAVDQLLLRSEFYTAYTPYQAELSQGTLQVTYEFQTMVCQLLGMETSNASMYCAASGAAEAVLMSRRIFRSKRKTTLLSQGLHPHYLGTIDAYLHGQDGTPDMGLLPLNDAGQTDLAALAEALHDGVASVVVQYPNFVGSVEDLAEIRRLCDAHGTLMITVTAEPYALSLLKSPGECGADIAVGEGQGLAVPLQLGGPGVGLFACKKKYVRQMPGRLVGETVDADGVRGFVLTLSTREQHIRREKATSNICTNHGLIASAMAIRTAMLGKQGFVQVGERCLSNAEYLKSELQKIPGVTLPFSAPTFNEFVVRFEHHSAESIAAAARKDDVLVGLPLLKVFSGSTIKGAIVGNASDLLVAVTEKHTRADLERLVTLLSRYAKSS